MKPSGKLKRKFRNTPGDSHFYTTSTDFRRKHFLDDRICQALAKRINEAAEKHRFAVLAYVFMPDHIHLLIHHLDEVYSMEVIAKAIKQGVSNRAKSQGWISTDLWESGGGHDRNIFSERARKNAISYIHENPVKNGLVESSVDYFWSSANWYYTGEEGAIRCQYYSSL